MKKALGQTVRDIKREVNKKVLKVPSIEQKVLDATSNEPWGPHGSLLAVIAHASRNYHEYQMIMSVIWKRINDTGKNWRHVYKALTVLEYLVAHGTERVIDDIREHGYQIATLSDFQYIDSSGRDQGNNVRKKSQSLIVLVNDKERIQEVRQKATSNRDKYRESSMGSMPPPGSISSSGSYGDKYDDDRFEGRYGNRDDHRNGPVRERDWNSRDDDRNSRYGGSDGEEGERNGRDSEGHHGQNGYSDGHYGPRSRSADPYLDRDSVDDGQCSTRGSGAKGDDQSQDGSTTSKSFERKYSEQNLGAPPSYEEIVGATRSPTYSERDGESTILSAPQAAPPTDSSPGHTAVTSPPTPQAQSSNDEVDEFDPRVSSSVTPTMSNGVAPATSGGADMDLLGSLSEEFLSNSLALVPANEPTMTFEANVPADFGFGATSVAESSASIIPNQPFDDPFGEGPFKAVPSTTTPQSLYMPSNPFSVQPPSTSPQFMQQDMSIPNKDFDILADILPQFAPSSFVTAQIGYPIPADHSVSHTGFPPNDPISQLSPQFVNAPQNSFPIPTHPADQPSLPTNYHLQSAESITQNSFPSQSLALAYPGQSSQSGVHYHSGQPMSHSGYSSQMGFSQAGNQTPPARPNPPNSNFYGAYHSQLTAGAPVVPSNPSGPITHPNALSQSGTAVHVASTGSLAIVPQPSKDKFETKSAIWADTLSRGLVNLNIAGSKTNPTADIGVDFDALNRKDKRMEKPTVAAVTSTVTMGKAMGSGSGIGRAGVLRPAPNPMVGSGINFAMAGGPGVGMGDYGANQQMGRGMNMGMGVNVPGNMGMGMSGPGNTGMGMNMPRNMGMGINMPGNMEMGMNRPGNMAMGQGMQQQTGFLPGATMPGGHNPTMGPGNFGQLLYGGGYRLA